jgi:hypothetical protein
MLHEQPLMRASQSFNRTRVPWNATEIGGVRATSAPKRAIDFVALSTGTLLRGWMITPACRENIDAGV